jgi:hypothetical protein
MDTIGLDLHKRESQLCLGHDAGTVEVIVADPNVAPMYATRSRRTKTDRREARTLMEACRLGAYRLAHRVSPARRHVRAELAVRDALVRTRTRYIAVAKALVRRDGLRVAASDSHLVAKRIAALDLSDTLSAGLFPLFEILAPDQRADCGGGSSPRRARRRRSGHDVAGDGAVYRAHHGECDRCDGR